MQTTLHPADGQSLFPLLVTTTKTSTPTLTEATSTLAKAISTPTESQSRATLTEASRTFKIVKAEWFDPAGVKLRDAQVAEINTRFGNSDTPPGIPPSASNISLFLLAYETRTDNTEPVACGAVRELGDGYMEIKRMYAIPSARGTGASLAILVGLEQYAKSLGVKGLRLETAILQPDAMRFYAKYGYEEIPRFGHYENVEWSRCYEKNLEAENDSV